MKERKIIPEKEIRQIELDIFRQIIRVCEKYELRYIMDYGTLLGAVRHGGFIPWDDDIDLSMPRPDFEKFYQVFEQEMTEYPQYELRRGMKSDLALPYIQIVHTGTITEKNGRREKYGQALWVDIFPIDGGGNSRAEIEQVHAAYWEKINESRQIFGRYKPYLNPIKQIRQFYTHHIRSFALGKIIAEAEQCMQTYDYEQSELIFCYCTFCGTKEINKKKYYEDRIELEFEGIPCKVPRDYDEKLKNIYGDYMQLPPEEERKGHDFVPFYR